MKIPSILDLQEFSSVYEAIEYVKSLEPAYVSAPRRPTLSQKHTSAETKQYVKLLEQYEADLLEHTLNTTERRSIAQQLYTVLEDYIKNESGFYDYVPSERQDKVWNYAWQQGHSSGYNEVYSHLLELVDIFE